MQLSGFNQWLSLTANLGVLVGIVFLIAELDQANRIARNESESNLGLASVELSASAKESAGLLVKLMDGSSTLTAQEIIESEYLTFEFMSIWGAANTAYRNGLITEYLFEIYMSDMKATLDKYPKMAETVSRIYRPRWANVPEGESVLIDRVRVVLLEKGLSI